MRPLEAFCLGLCLGVAIGFIGMLRSPLYDPPQQEGDEEGVTYVDLCDICMN